MNTLFTFYIFIIMLGITLIHIYWYKGGYWPGENKQDFIDKVIGREVSLPGKGMYTFVIICFFIMAIFPITVYYKINIGINTYEKYFFLAFGVIFTLRALGMFIPVLAKRATKIFLEYNKKYYAPLCITLAIAYFGLYYLNL
ncbi:hypothetical protein CP965_03240 [Halarcobacter mediterraneus]|uniref:DUF3995 domain-containing protein n=1 Tax=Halarcobacter mediterraneus TaxID=2023153 RepID=A0A4Q1B5R5_9BACT|nr:DUF3995 domain-containing protein [Halarcobacter mediterraneus]RXK14477.1 hypothetical protein CP965_03240 [Halarcobacter mediterraneus]